MIICRLCQDACAASLFGGSNHSAERRSTGHNPEERHLQPICHLEWAAEISSQAVIPQPIPATHSRSRRPVAVHFAPSMKPPPSRIPARVLLSIPSRLGRGLLSLGPRLGGLR